MLKKLIIPALALIITTAAVFVFVNAGNLNPTLAPGDTMHTLEDIYCKITGCTASTSYALSREGTATGTMYTLEEIYDVANGGYYGRNWQPETTGSNATTSLTMANCESASGWEWFEDGNGDGDTTDPEDGICVLTTAVSALTWNGMDYLSWRDNTYIADYECEGNFPSGTIVSGSYSGIDSGGAADTTWNDGDCALCQADCYDGRKDLPDQIGQDGGAYTGEAYGQTSHDGPLTPEVLVNWKGTRLPTFFDFFGFCGASSGDSDSTAGDSLYHSSGASSDKTLGNYGYNAGRGLNASPNDEYLDLSNTSYEWLSEQVDYLSARVAGNYACSYSSTSLVFNGNRFRAVFRP